MSTWLASWCFDSQSAVVFILSIITGQAKIFCALRVLPAVLSPVTLSASVWDNIDTDCLPVCHVLYFVYLLVFIDVNDMEMKREADSNDITECSHDDNPSVGMFVVFLMLYSLQSFLCVWFSCFPVVLMGSLYVLHQHVSNQDYIMNTELWEVICYIFCHILSNHLEFWRETSHICYLFIRW